MNKNKIAIAVFAVIAAASSARAQDFDGRTGNAGGLALSASAIETATEYDIPLPQEPGVAPIPSELPPCGEYTILPWPLPCNNTPQFPPNCQQPDNNSWWWIAECGFPMPTLPDPLYLDEPLGAARRGVAAKASHNGHLTDLILGYANTYPEFAAAVLPVFKDKNASVVYDSKGAYIMSGKTVVRLDFAKLSRMVPAAPASRQTRIAPALEVALYIVETGAAWYGAYQVWNEYHSSDNDSGSSNSGPQDNSGNIQPNLHQAQHDLDYNIQRTGAIH